MIKCTCLLAIGFCFGTYNVSAQLAPATSISQQTSLGKYTAERTVENLVGSMYLYDEVWKPAEVKSSDGRIFKDLTIKYDIVNDLLLYKGKSNEVMEFVTPVNEFIVSNGSYDLVFKNGYKDINKNTARTFYQVLFEGKIQILKKVTKTIIEAQNYNSPSIVKNIDMQTRYYFVNKNGDIVSVKNNKNDVLFLLKDKSEQMNKYISTHKVDFKKDLELAKIFEFYDSLL